MGFSANLGDVLAQAGDAISEVIGLDVALAGNASNREVQASSQFAADPVQ